MKKLSKIFVFAIALFLPFFAMATESPSSVQKTPDYVASIDRLLEKGNDTDYLEIKLTIDKLIDPSINNDAVRNQIAKMVDDINAMLSEDMTEWDKVLILRKYIYDSGEWNNHRPFSYDLDDPLGKSRTSRLLHYFLKTRKGNCVSMPILHAILGQKIGLDMTVSTAPLHMFVQYTNENGQTINIEATSGGHTSRTAWYQKNLPMLPLAIKNGMFLKKLTTEETIAVMGHDLANHLLLQGPYKDSILVSERLIKLFPNYGPLYLSRGSAFSKLIDTEFKAKYPDHKSIPVELRSDLKYYFQQNMASFKIAEELGWRDPDELAKERKLLDKQLPTPQ